MPRAAESKPTAFAQAVVVALRERMTERDRNQASVSRLSGIKPNYLSERMNGVKSFTLSDMEALGRALDFDPAEFLCGIKIPGEAQAAPVLDIFGVGRAADDAVQRGEPLEGIAAKKQPRTRTRGEFDDDEAGE